MQAARRLSLLSKNSSFSDSRKKVFYKIATAVCESNIQCSRSFAASAPSGASKRESNCKRVPLDERRGMVEAFVENYKTLNGGKFPTITEVRKQVGGGYYTVRRLVQELDHKSKTSHVSEADQHLLQTKVPKKEDQGFAKVEGITSTEPAVDLKSHELSSAAKEEPSTIIITNDVEAEVKPEVCHRAEKPLTGEAAEADQHLLQTKVPKKEDQGFAKVEGITSTEPAVDLKSHELSSAAKEEPSTIIITNDVEAEVKPEVCHRAEKSLTGEAAEVKSSTVIISRDLEAKEKPQIPDKLSRNISSKESKEDPVPEVPNIWGKLRSFAGDVIKLWRKL